MTPGATQFPRCIVGLRPRPAAALRPDILSPNTVYPIHQWQRSVRDVSAFAIGCPCGHPAVFLLGYFVTDGGGAKGFVGPLGLECAKCEAISEFFDTRSHGYDGEQGCNTYVIGEGKPDRFICPRCGVMPFIIRADFSYPEDDCFAAFMKERPQDFFASLSIAGQCMNCNSLIEITSFECA
jgi:hypothetical protein